MRYTRIYAGPDGESHFEDLEIDLREVTYAPPAPPYFVSDATPASAVALTRLPAGWHGDWHPSPRLQWWFQLAGELDVRTSDGDSRRFGPGAIVRVEDTTGRGHTTTVVSPEAVEAVYVHIPERFACPCCGYKTLEQEPPGSLEICEICRWEDDWLQFDNPDYPGGANTVSLREAQRNFEAIGTSDPRSEGRSPTPGDVRDPDWNPLDNPET